MKTATIDCFISQPRFGVYLQKCENNVQRAYTLYIANIKISEALYPSLCVVELSLRNAINTKMKVYFEDPYWFKNKLPKDMLPFISQVEQKMNEHKKQITTDRIVSELHFGFWTRLFNKHNAQLLWKPLNQLLPNLPKHQRKREFVSDRINQIRILRNRVYHYESICWDLDKLQKQYYQIQELVAWLDNDLSKLLSQTDKFIDTLQKVKEDIFEDETVSIQ